MLLEVAQETYDQPDHIALLKEWFWKVNLSLSSYLLANLLIREGV